MASWRYHHKLQPEQLAYAERGTTVEEVGFYHGGDPVYKLAGIPGLWLEQCLVTEVPSFDGGFSPGATGQNKSYGLAV